MTLNCLLFGFMRCTDSVVALLVLCYFNGFLLIVAGIVILILMRRKIVLLIGIGLFTIPYVWGIVSSLHNKLYEKELAGNYKYKDKFSNTILKLSGDKSFELKPTDSTHNYGCGTWKLKEEESCVCLYLNFKGNKDSVMPFVLHDENKRVILEECNWENKITLIKQ
jgi:hypothetical protein